MTKPTQAIRILSFGGGVNSSAILVGLWERGESLDLCLFSDTGSEKPHTYDHLALMSEWNVSHGLPAITTIRPFQPQQIIDGSLDQECIRLGKLPSKAYGFSACSVKWKIEPMQRWLRNWRKETGYEGEVLRMVGYDADEVHRSIGKDKGRDGETMRYPLIEWGWGREDCVAAIKRAGLEVPGKSACFMCPSSKRREILELDERYPELMARALEMERRALDGEGSSPKTTCAGLGRHFAWRDVIQAKRDQSVLYFSDAGTPETCDVCID